MRKAVIMIMAAVLAAACTTLEVKDRSFEVDVTSAYDDDLRGHALILRLIRGELRDTYRMSWSVDGAALPCLTSGGDAVRQGDEIRFGQGRKAVYTFSGLDKGEHRMVLRITNGLVTETEEITFSITPDHFTPEVRVFTKNIDESVLEVRFSEHDADETYRMSATVDGTPLLRDSVITVPSFSIPLGALLPGIRTVQVRIRDSFAVWEKTVKFTEPARERFMDLVLACERDRHGQRLNYHLTARKNVLPCSASVSVHFIIDAAVTVRVQNKEGDRPYGTIRHRRFEEFWKGVMDFDGSSGMLLDVRKLKRKVAGYTEPSILSWSWNEVADWYTPRDIVDVPYGISEIVPDMRIEHDRIPGVRIRVENTAGKIRINGREYTEKEIVI